MGSRSIFAALGVVGTAVVAIVAAALLGVAPQTIMFYTFGIALLTAGTMVIAVRNPVHAALYLVLAFVSSACLWVQLEAEFLGIALVLVYVGAVMVLFLFVVMMLDVDVAALREGYAKHAPVGVLVALAMIAEIVYVVWSRRLGVDLAPTVTTHELGYSNTRALGQALYTDYVYPFEIAGVLLLVGIVAAIALTMRRRGNTRTQDPAVQVRVRRADRLRIVQVPVEREEDAG